MSINQCYIRSVNRSYGDQCGVARSLDVIGERWALLIVRELLLGPKRFNDLLAGLAGASPNVISQRLRELTGSGVIRHRDLGPPARVRVYELTDWGRELEPVILHLGQWGTRAPLPEGARSSLDSLILALQATADPAVVDGRYELRVDTDVFTVDGTSGSVRVRPLPPTPARCTPWPSAAVPSPTRWSPATCASTATRRLSAASPACYRR